MKPSIKIISVNNKWAKVMYNSSNSRSRMPLDRLVEQHENNRIEIVNPQKLDEIEF